MRYFFLVLLIFFVACDFGFSGDHNDGSFNDFSDNSVDNSVTEIIEEDVLTETNCDRHILGVDGPGGFLWKPISDSDGNLVILFPPSFSVEFQAVSVETLEGEVESGVFDGFSNPNRQTWRFSQPGEAYSGVVSVTTNTEICTWVVTQPDQVQD